MTERLRLLGFPVDAGLEAGQVVSQLYSAPTLLSYLNPYAWKVALVDRQYRGNLQRMDLVSCDGLAIRHAARVILGKSLEIISMDESGIAPAYLGTAQQRGLRLCLVGATREALQAATLQIRSDHPDICIDAAFPGFGEGPSEALDAIVKSQPHLVLAGMGMGLQEQFLLKCREQGWKGSGICVGAFFDRLANPDHDYPEWSRKHNLRFLGNLTRRPAYYLKRYGLDYWPFLKQYGAHILGRKDRSP